MVFWTQEGDFFPIKLAGKDLDQISLDKAFGLEVELEGKILPSRSSAWGADLTTMVTSAISEIRGFCRFSLMPLLSPVASESPYFGP